jgi:hypothetical protein
MTKVIWKSELVSAPTAVVQMPKGARVLSVGRQEGLVVWYLCDPEAPSIHRLFRIESTGIPFLEPMDRFLRPPPKESFIGTVTNGDGGIHVFDCGEISAGQ